ncbi:hypothetical protein FHG87_019164 [Trinorchestia longiramus]|nr:hypothetical protein FHG87_019164 [Trinorchestia longiramus]
MYKFERKKSKKNCEYAEKVIDDMNEGMVIVQGGEKELLENGREVTENAIMKVVERAQKKNVRVAVTRNGLHTWESKEWKAAIDNVLVSHEARRYVRKMYVDENEFDIDTDHRMLVLKCK